MSIQITLNRIGVAAPVQRAAMIATDVIAAALTAFADNNLIKPTMPNQFFQFQVRGPDLSSDERRIMYENWLFAKGFQDLARGVRASLEEAALYLCLISNPPRRIPSSSTIGDLLQMRRKPISHLSFPELLSKVNSELTSPLAFEQEFISIQKVRNCLEHRDGVVRRQDLDNSANALVLNFPRIKFFYMRSGQEIELASDDRVDDGAGQSRVQILGRLVTHSKKYQLGDRVTFSGTEFSEIAMACSLFGHQLSASLPSKADCT